MESLFLQDCQVDIEYIPRCLYVFLYVFWHFLKLISLNISGGFSHFSAVLLFEVFGTLKAFFLTFHFFICFRTSNIFRC